MKLEREGNILKIEIELGEGRPSSTGKTTVLYSSGGFQWNSEKGVGINLTVCKSKK